jgi:hypothetical protein
VNTDQARRLLEQDLPPVTLLIGSRLDELWPLAHHLVKYWGVKPGDYQYCYNLSAESARDLVKRVSLVPFGDFQLILVKLEGASEQAQNILLKVLEEPPPRARFLLLAQSPPLATVMSRAQVYRLGASGHDLLNSDEGQAARTKVGVALKAAMGSDQAALVAATRGWEPMHIVQLGAWAAEASTGRWNVFDPGFAPGATMEQARRVLVLLESYAGARTAGAVALAKTFVES